MTKERGSGVGVSRRSWGHPSLLLLAVMLLAPSLPTSAKQFDVSQGVPGRNILPRVVANPKNGDFLVAWTQQIAGTSNLRAWTRLFKRKKSGKYQRKAAVMVSPAAGWNADTEIAWVPWLNRWVVLWDTLDLFVAPEASPIRARYLKAKSGKPKGKVKTVIANGRANTWPRVAIDHDDGGAPQAAASQGMILAFTAFPTTPGQSDTGVTVVRLKNNLKTRGKSRVISEPIDFFAAPASAPGGPVAQIERTTPQIFVEAKFVEVVEDLDKTFGVSWDRHSPVTGQLTSGVTYMKPDTLKTIQAAELAQGSVQLKQLPNSRRAVFVVGTGQFAGSVRAVEVSPKISKSIEIHKETQLAANPRVLMDGAELPSSREITAEAGGPGGYVARFHYTDPTHVSSRDVLPTGNDAMPFEVGPPQKRFPHGGRLNGLAADVYYGKGAVVEGLAWGKKNSAADEDVILILEDL